MFTKNLYFCMAAVVCFCLVSNSFAAEPNDLPYAADRILVKFAPQTDGKQKTTIERNAVISAHKVGSVKRLLKFVPDVSVVELPKDVNVPDALKLLKDDPNIICAEADWKLHLGSTEPNDPIFPDQWGLKNTGAWLHEGDGRYSIGTQGVDIDAINAWDVNTTSSITVAIIDTGVDYTHPDLSGNMWTNQNGYHGYDFVNNDNYPLDDHYHGTHVAGIIGAVGNNGIGVCGVAWKVKIMVLKTFNSQGIGYSSDAIDAIDYAIDNGAKVINASWGWYSNNPRLTDSTLLRQAIQRANSNGILFITEADNLGYNIDVNFFYPASYSRTDCPNLVAVMATKSSDYVANMPNYSNYGPNSVDIAAPGQEIYSTMPTTVTAGMWYYDSQGHLVHLPTNYYLLDGTSMSTAFISGACALVWSHMKSQPPYDCNYIDVKNTILNTAEQLPVLTGKCRTGGRLNLDNAIRNTIPIPQARNITKGTNHDTIQAAVNNADNNDLIVLDKGTYYENIDVNSTHATGLTIRSIDPDNPSITVDIHKPL